MDKALAKFPNLKIILSNTTRPSRQDGVDERTYHFWANAEFDREIAAGRLIETGSHSGFRYGLHIPYIEAELGQKNGVIALIPSAAEMIFGRLNDAFSVKILALQPSFSLLMANTHRRGIKTNGEILTAIREDTELRLRKWAIPITAVDLNGTPEDEKILDLFNPERS